MSGQRPAPLPRRQKPGLQRPVAVKHACYSGENLTDPKRADRAIRKFSWETA
jgi:hypothetical protein